MPVTPLIAASRRSVLRAVAVAGSTAAVAPALVGAAAQAAPQGGAAAAAASGSAGLRRVKVGPKKAKKCKRSRVRVKGRCRPKKKFNAFPTTAPTGPTDDQDATTPPPQPLPATQLLNSADRHLVSRFSYGVDAALAAQVNAAGGAAYWFEQQLAAGTADPATDALKTWWPSLSRSAQDMWARQQSGAEGGWMVMFDYQRYLLVRRMRSTRTVLDVMTEFWENHLNVPVNGDAQFLYRVAYGDTVRANALGRFDALLTSCVTHPAMLLFLNAAVSTATHPNENLGRELLELHTVGRGQYTEDDVKNSARILTGYHVDMWRTWVASYQSADHWRGPVTVMGFSDANASADGRATATAYLRYLAHHPATAQRIARRLAVKFVSDDPPQALVDSLAQTYLDNDTAIVPVLRELVASSAFATAALQKVRDPGEDVVATYKALGITVGAPANPRDGNSAEQAILWQTGNLGALPHGWPRPDGAPSDNVSWSSPSRLVASLDLHYSLSGGWWPSTGIAYRSPASWLPSPSVTFADLVEHLSRQILHMTTPPGLLAACSLAVDVQPTAVITAQHGLVRWSFVRLLATLLDSPHHMKR